MYDDFRLEMMRGDDRSFTIAAKKPDGTGPQDITGWDIWFTGKPNLKLTDAEATFQKTTLAGAGITITNPANGLAKIKLDSEDTAALLSRATELYCDVQGRDIVGDKATLASGIIVVHADVTRV